MCADDAGALTIDRGQQPAVGTPAASSGRTPPHDKARRDRDDYRYLRRLNERFGSRFSARRSRGLMVKTDRELIDAHTPPDVTSLRAKSTRHRKVTADKWNQ